MVFFEKTPILNGKKKHCGQQFKVGAVMNLEDLALQPVAQTA